VTLLKDIRLVKVNDGEGLVIFEDVRKGEKLMVLDKNYIYSPTRHSIQVDADIHWNPTTLEGFLNHSCEPNIALLGLPSLEFIAIDDITAGSELRFSYLTTETQMSCPFQCTCGSEHCFGHIAGFSKLSRDQKIFLRERYKLPNYLLELI
jgi:hypothetical protein